MSDVSRLKAQLDASPVGTTTIMGADGADAEIATLRADAEAFRWLARDAEQKETPGRSQAL